MGRTGGRLTWKEGSIPLRSTMKRKPEQELSNAIRLAVGSLPDVRLWRNNTGTLIDSRGIPVSYGLAVGSADTIGIVAPFGRMLSIEVKAPGFKPPSDRKLAEARKHPGGCKCQPCKHNRQLDWRNNINLFGGVAAIVDSLEAALELVALARIPVATEGPWDEFRGPHKPRTVTNTETE